MCTCWGAIQSITLIALVGSRRTPMVTQTCPTFHTSTETDSLLSGSTVLYMLHGPHVGTENWKLTEFLLRGKTTIYSNIGFLWPKEKFLQESPYRAPTGKTAVGFMWAHPLEDKCGFAPTVSQFTTTVGPYCLKGHCLIWMSKIWACYPAMVKPTAHHSHHFYPQTKPFSCIDSH